MRYLETLPSMIIKIKSHKRDSFQKILEYMISGRERFLNEKTFTLTHNLKGKTIADWTSQFKTNELFRINRRKDSVRLTHEILSWHRDDSKHLTLEKLEDLTREYIRQRNSKGVFVAVPHFDKKNYHVHLLASGVEYKTGKSMRLSKVDMASLKKEIQKYQEQKCPEITNSDVEHGRTKSSAISEREFQYKLRTGREADKAALQKILETCYKKSQSKKSFFDSLKKSNLKTYWRNGKETGIFYNGKKFRFSRLGYDVERFENLDRFFARTKMLSAGRRNSQINKYYEREL